MRRFYKSFELFRNLFIPSFKLIGKERIGAKVRKTYGELLSPCERLIRDPQISKEQVQALRDLKAQYDPIKLAREVQQRRDRFFDAVGKRAGARPDRLRRAGRGPFSPPGANTRGNSTSAPVLATV